MNLFPFPLLGHQGSFLSRSAQTVSVSVKDEAVVGFYPSPPNVSHTTVRDRFRSSSVSVCSTSPICPRHHQSLTEAPQSRKKDSERGTARAAAMRKSLRSDIAWVWALNPNGHWLEKYIFKKKSHTCTRTHKHKLIKVPRDAASS